MFERACFAVVGLSVVLSSCAQTPPLTADDDGSEQDGDTPKAAPTPDETTAPGPGITTGGRTALGADAGGNGARARSTRTDAGGDTSTARDGDGAAPSATRVPVGDGADGSAAAPRGEPQGSGAGGGTIVGVTRVPENAGACHVPGDAQLEDVSRPTTVVGNGSASSCTSGAFVDAVAKGGVITFNCGASPVTIHLQQTAKVVNSARKVVIDGGGKVALSGDGGRRILYQNTCDQAQGWATGQCDNQSFPELTVQNLTFVDGNARGSNEGDGGGAIFAQGGRLKILNSHFFSNTCADVGPDVGGGAVRALQQYNNQPVYIVNSTFGGQEGRGNVGSNGGALSAIGVSYVLIGSTLTHNRAIGHGANPAKPGTPGGGSGGAIYTDGTDFTLRLCGTTIAHNQANEHGGGIFFVSNDRSGSLYIDSSTLEQNPAGEFENFPGMFVLANGQPHIAGSQIR